jgi:GNAT superfamily N-acetyltransferase
MSFRIVPGGVEHVDTIVEHRRSMFYDMGHREIAALDAMAAALRPWLLRRLESGEYLAWFACDEAGGIIGGVGLWLMDWLPHMIGPDVPRGNIVNVYTSPEHRRQGIARALVQTALDWSRANGLKSVILHSSAEGRPLYDKLGFRPTNEMRILL